MSCRIAIGLGSRANFGSTRSTMIALRRRGAEVLPILFASALSDRYGDVKASLARDDFKPFACLSSHVEGDVSDMGKVAGIATMEWSTFLRNNPVDTVVVIGDRHEIVAPAIAAAYSGVRVMHQMGGERSGNVDDRIRDAVTAFAGADGLHCVATENAGRRVGDLLGVPVGPGTHSIHVTGCPRIDTVKEALTTRPDVRPMILVSQHPVTTSWQSAHAEMSATLRAVEVVAQRHRLQVELFWPNADAGTGGTHQAIRDWLNSEGGNSVTVRTHRAMGPHEYARMMASCRVMVGNSSSALRDGAWIGTPAVNVGDRQRGREHGANVVDVPEPSQGVKSAALLEDALEVQISHGPFRCSTLYGDGSAGERVSAAILGDA